MAHRAPEREGKLKRVKSVRRMHRAFRALGALAHCEKLASRRQKHKQRIETRGNSERGIFVAKRGITGSTGHDGASFFFVSLSFWENDGQ